MRLIGERQARAWIGHFLSVLLLASCGNWAGELGVNGGLSRDVVQQLLPSGHQQNHFFYYSYYTVLESAVRRATPTQMGTLLGGLWSGMSRYTVVCCVEAPHSVAASVSWHWWNSAPARKIINLMLTHTIEFTPVQLASFGKNWHGTAQDNTRQQI